MEQLNSLTAYQFLVSNPNSLLIDVRTELEWQGDWIPNVKNMILSSFDGQKDAKQEKDFEQIISIIAKDTLLIFICRSCIRSSLAASYAKEKGYNNCCHILDGFNGSSHGVGWKANKLPIKEYCVERS